MAMKDDDVERREPERDWDGALELARQSLERGDWIGTETACRELMEAATQAGRLEVAAEAALTGAKAAFNDAALERAEPLARQAIHLATECASSALLSAAWVVLAGVHARADRSRESTEALVHALEHLAIDLPTRVRRSIYLGIDATYGALGLWRLAAAAGAAAREADEALDPGAPHTFSCLTYIDSLLRAHDDHDRGSPDAAATLLAAARREMTTLERWVNDEPTPWLRCYAQLLKGSIQRRAGDPASALATLRGLAEGDARLDPDMRFVVWVERAEAEAALGDPVASRRSARVAIEHLEQAAAHSPGSAGLTELQRLWRVQQIVGDAAAALDTLSTYHQRVLRNTMAWMDAKAASLSRQLSEATLRLQNADLREHNATLSRRVEDIARVASTDGLTHVLTRRAVTTVYDQLAAQGRPMGLLLTDVDHFKAVNDGHGHLIGDRVLIEVARRLQLALRTPDHIGRFGGEEFVVLLPGITFETAATVAERLRCAVEAEGWTALATGLAVTISIGSTMVVPGESFESVLQRADAALYQAKRSGRNRVVAQRPADPLSSGRAA